MSQAKENDADVLIVGAGFYGCCLALFLRSVIPRIKIVDATENAMTRASRVNQARVHTGYHYPRSMLTAARSMMLHRRFVRDFGDAVVDDFDMLYAISSRNSSVSAERFRHLFENIGAPISVTTPNRQALFQPDMIEAVFDCTEYAFDYSRLREHLLNQVDTAGLDLEFGAKVIALKEELDAVRVGFADGREMRVGTVFNVTYANVNQLIRSTMVPLAALKHEVTEIVLVRQPADMNGLAVTVMDGPFFSIMPYPAEDLYSMTHVRYTPHLSWQDSPDSPPPDDVLRQYPRQSMAKHMINDAARYMPCLGDLEVKKSLVEVKTVLTKNERDDGRPILFHRQPSNSRIISVLGGKIDNVYDLFDLVKTSRPEWTKADLTHLLGRV